MLSFLKRTITRQVGKFMPTVHTYLAYMALFQFRSCINTSFDSRIHNIPPASARQQPFLPLHILLPLHFLLPLHIPSPHITRRRYRLSSNLGSFLCERRAACYSHNRSEYRTLGGQRAGLVRPDLTWLRKCHLTWRCSENSLTR